MAGTPSRRASYKDTLQPALHRRFSSTAALLLAASYLEALLLATWTSFFWSWFPLGPSGVRTGLIFSCGLAILVLRIANYHVGAKTAASGLHALGASLVSARAYETGFWYGVSALLFCPVFLASAPEPAKLRWITYFSGDRARLNERPLFLACYLGTCALWQTMRHHRLDMDRLDLGLPGSGARDRARESAALSGSLQAFLSKLPRVLSGSLKQAGAALVLALVLYYLFLRSFAWGWVLTFLRPFYSLPQTRMLPPSWPTDVFLLTRCVYAGTLLFFVWSAGNTAFSLFMVRQPLKNGKPLTSESKDPNGSLLNGLKSKKLSIKAFAMWELALISRDFDARRQTIYQDIDRKDGPMWAQIYAVCAELLESIESQVDKYGKPDTLAATEPAEAAPRLRSFAPLRDEPILNKPTQASGLIGGVERAWDQVGRAPGASPVSELSPIAKKTWEGARDRLLSKEQQEALSADHIRGGLEHWAAGVMKVGWVGGLLRQDFGTRFAAAVLGAPYAEPTLYGNAAEALSRLAVHSLAEDEFGNVQRDVASMVRTMTAVIGKVEALRARFPDHWTDPAGGRECAEVDAVTAALRAGLGRVVAAFEPYSGDLGLSRGEVRLAREAAARPAEAAARPAEAAPREREAAAAAKEAAKEAAGAARGAERRKTSRPRRAQERAQERAQRGVEMEQVR